MNRLFLASLVIALSSAVLHAQQQSSPQDPYQGTSNPPADDTIVTDAAPQAKPAPGKPMTPEAAPNSQAAPAQDPAPNQVQPSSVDPSLNNPPADVSSGAASLPPAAVAPQPALEPRAYTGDPDGDIVHPEIARPGEIVEGTTIRVRLLDRLSTAETEKGEPFRSQVATDVLQSGQVLIPAGTEIDGTVIQVSTGRVGSSGYIRLRPEKVMLPDGSRYQIHAEITGTPGSHTHVVGEGTIKPDSRWKRDSIEYGGAVGVGAVTGAVLGGPVGALTGGLIGAGIVTTHLLVSHPQADLAPGTTLLFTLTDPMFMTPPAPSGN
jgi:hypothetical protein